MAVVALVLALVGATAAQASTGRPDLVVAQVEVPYPVGTAPGSGFQLEAVVANKGGGRASARSRVGYFLSKDSTLGKGDIRIPAQIQRLADITPRLKPGHRDLGSEGGVVPLGTDPGLYRLIACADVKDRVAEARERNNCATLKPRIAIQNPPSALAPSSTATSSPLPEYFPEEQPFPELPPNWTVKKTGACPASAHGQGFPTTNAFYTDKTSDCAWVERDFSLQVSSLSPWYADAQQGRYFALYYCPSSYPYPFEVAIGFDPMWLDVSGSIPAYSGPASTRPVSRTKYKVISNQVGNRALYSYAGSKGVSRGYAYFSVGVKQVEQDTYIAGEVKYLCSDTRATSYLP